MNKETANITNYVVGFAFNEFNVLLIKKVRPKWQSGLYNGLGGHIEANESPVAAMVREFKEECSISTIESDWEQFAIMRGEDWLCYCFRSRNAFDLADAKTMTDERVQIINAYALQNYPTISNLPALIGLAMDGHGPQITIMDYSVQITASNPSTPNT